MALISKLLVKYTIDDFTVKLFICQKTYIYTHISKRFFSIESTLVYLRIWYLSLVSTLAPLQHCDSFIIFINICMCWCVCRSRHLSSSQCRHNQSNVFVAFFVTTTSAGLFASSPMCLSTDWEFGLISQLCWFLGRMLQLRLFVYTLLTCNNALHSCTVRVFSSALSVPPHTPECRRGCWPFYAIYKTFVYMCVCVCVPHTRCIAVLFNILLSHISMPWHKHSHLTRIFHF